MKKEDYYALVRYRGREKYYYIPNSMEEGEDKDGYDTRLEYIDYNPKREWSGVWIKNGKDKIIEKFDKTTPHYRYFTKLNKNWDTFMKSECERQGKIYKTEVFFLGTCYVNQAYKKALKETPNPLNIEISPKK